MRLGDGQLGLLGALTAACALIVFSGCGGAFDASVRGVVTLNQAELHSGTVKFVPEGSGPSAYGLIDSNGAYSIMTGREAGLPSGPYVVTVVSNEESVPGSNPSAPPAPGKPITPAWYRDSGSSPLKFKVASGKNEINLDLTSQPPPGWKPTGRR